MALGSVAVLFCPKLSPGAFVPMDEPFAMDISTPNGAFVVVGAVLVGYLREKNQAIKLSNSGILWNFFGSKKSSKTCKTSTVLHQTNFQPCVEIC